MKENRQRDSFEKNTFISLYFKKKDLESSLADLRIYQTLRHNMWLIAKSSRLFIRLADCAI
jgi:hypothetical protein